MLQCSSGRHSCASMAALVGGSFTDVQESSGRRRMSGKVVKEECKGQVKES